MKINPREVEYATGDELRFDIGTNVLVEPYGGAGLQFRTEFVGMFPRRYVAARLPVTRKVLDALPKDRQLNFRFLRSGGQVCGFQSRVLHLMVRPFPILFAEFPHSIEIFNLRKHDRVLCYLPINLFQSGNEAKGVIMDISSGGCRVLVTDEHRIVAESMDTAQEISCLFTLFDSQHEVLVNSQIKGMEKRRKGLVLGLAFKEPGEEITSAIDAYTDQVKAHLGV